MSKSMSSSSRSGRGKRGKRRNLFSQPSLGGVMERRSVFNNVGKPTSFRLPVPSPSQEYRFVTTYITSAYLTSSNSVEVDIGSSYSLSNMNAAELAGLQAVFDQYRIRAIETFTVPRTAFGAGTSTQNTGTLVSAVDYDNATPITVANLATFTNSLVSAGVDTHYHAWTPTITGLAGASAGSSGVATVTERSPWLDLAVATTPHYGLKTSITVTDAAYVFDQHVRLHLAFRQKI